MKGKPIPLFSLPYASLIRNRYPSTIGLTKIIFKSSGAQARIRIHDPRATASFSSDI